MPHTLKYRPDLIDELISSNRITTYSNVFAPSNDMELVGAYLWNKQVAASLLPLASAIEVAIRNHIDQALVRRLKIKWWKSPQFLTKNETRGKKAPDIKQWIIDGFDESGRQYGKDQFERHGSDTRLHAPITHGDYVSRQDLVTWQHLLDNQFNPLLWPAAIGEVFKGPAPASVKTVTDKQNHAKTQLIAIRKFRNRIAHNEPVWKTATVGNENDALRELDKRITALETFLLFISPELHKMMTVNGFIRNARRLATKHAILYAQHQITPKKVRSLRQLGQIVGDCSKNNQLQPAVIYLGRRTKFSVIPG